MDRVQRETLLSYRDLAIRAMYSPPTPSSSSTIQIYSLMLLQFLTRSANSVPNPLHIYSSEKYASGT
jgi:hypothetical protein